MWNCLVEQYVHIMICMLASMVSALLRPINAVVQWPFAIVYAYNYVITIRRLMTITDI